MTTFARPADATFLWFIPRLNDQCHCIRLVRALKCQGFLVGEDDVPPELDVMFGQVPPGEAGTAALTGERSAVALYLIPLRPRSKTAK